ncbi:Udp-glycosyltransferase 74f2 [Thalictrum thalictroides]|uniref:Glycosyltransferase n=1 Tax=Thalictrum thalictroides TaxID=46969 RepID=A0A7J6UXZ7_THATH|nr:Udp-glycosyltransferase 74f2 [Thalictrum thalictroides]
MEEVQASFSYKAHVLVLPFHGQGHMNPMLQFSKRLASKGIKITLAATLSATKNMPPQVGSISLEPIYDDLTHGGLDGADGLKGFIDRFQEIGSRNLRDLITKSQSSKYPIKCLVYDANLPWSLDVALGLGIMGAGFFTQSCATIATYVDMIEENSLESKKPLRSLEELGLVNMPDMGSSTGRYPSLMSFLLGHFDNIDKADWVLFNSFDKLEEEVVKNLMKLYEVRTIGPTLPSMYLDKRIEDDKDYGFNLYQSTGDTCINWLSTKERGSVVYVSFGSAARLSAEQMEEVAWALNESDANFLWVVRTSEENKLPSSFKEQISEKGLMVTWSPQLEVLSHEAVGCFVTHCGWNSTVEGVSLGVPMVAMPQFLDQFSDAKFVEEVWEIGVRPKGDDSTGLVSRKTIAECIKQVIQGERGEKIKRNASKWKQLARVALEEGGTSDRNIEEIVAKIVSN